MCRPPVSYTKDSSNRSPKLMVQEAGAAQGLSPPSPQPVPGRRSSSVGAGQSLSVPQQEEEKGDLKRVSPLKTPQALSLPAACLLSGRGREVIVLTKARHALQEVCGQPIGYCCSYTLFSTSDLLNRSPASLLHGMIYKNRGNVH